MIKTSIEKMSRDIGFDIGNSDDVVQSDLLNGLSDGLKLLDEHSFNTQLCYMSDKLNDNSKKVIKQLYEFIKE